MVEVGLASVAAASASICGPRLVSISTSSGPPSHESAAPLCQAAWPERRREPASKEIFSMAARPLAAGPLPAGAVTRAATRTSALAPCPSKAASVSASSGIELPDGAGAAAAIRNEATSPAVMSRASTSPCREGTTAASALAATDVAACPASSRGALSAALRVNSRVVCAPSFPAIIFRPASRRASRRVSRRVSRRALKGVAAWGGATSVAG